MRNIMRVIRGYANRNAPDAKPDLRGDINYAHIVNGQTMSAETVTIEEDRIRTLVEQCVERVIRDKFMVANPWGGLRVKYVEKRELEEQVRWLIEKYLDELSGPVKPTKADCKRGRHK